MCRYYKYCRQEHNIEKHCYYCHGHKSEDCWYHCNMYRIWGYHKGIYKKSDPHENKECIHISKNAHSLLNEYKCNCTICNKLTIHDRHRRLIDGHLCWKCSECNNILIL